MLRELGDELSEEVEGIGLVLDVSISASDDIDDIADDIRLHEDLEERFVLAKVIEGLASVECHVQILIFKAELRYELVDNHTGLLLQNLLHALLLWSELRLSVFAIMIAVVRGVPLVLLLGLDLLLNQLDHQGGK